MITRRMRHAAVVAGAAFALLLAGCGQDDKAEGLPPLPTPLASLGTGEGALNIIAWAGYAEDGTTDPAVDWVTPFEDKTGCKVNVTVGNTSDEMVTLMGKGGYDGVSASGDATLRLIYGDLVQPVNTDLVPNYATVSDFLKDQPWNSVSGQMFGIPHGWGANVLMWDGKVVTTAPDSWSSVFDPNSPYKGKITVYDSPIYIADAALYLMATQPDLEITNPYALDKDQLKAAIDLLKAQRPNIGAYWSLYTDEIQNFESGTTSIGTAWQINANLINANEKVSVGTAVPKEGATGWSDTWMVAKDAEHINCMYQWMDWIVSPEINAQVAEWFGEAPSQTKACDFTSEGFCDQFHALDKAYAEGIYYWTTPTKDCLDGRDSNCTTYSDWTAAWTGIKG